MEEGKTFVERRPSGQAVFVRKIFKLPPTSELLADAFSSRPHRRTLSLGRTRDEYRVVSAPTQRALPPPPMRVVAPVGDQTVTVVDPAGPPILGYPSHQQLGPLPPPFHPYFAHPNADRVLNPARYATADDLKYKCSVCGKFRSTSYHQRHPLVPGQIPPSSVCSRCKRSRTSSEGSSEESFRSRGHRRSRKKDAERMQNTPSDDERFSTIARRGSGVEVIRRSRSRSRDRHGRNYRPRDYSRSSSGNLSLLQVRVNEDQHLRRRSPSPARVVERIHYVHGRRRSPSHGPFRYRSRSRDTSRRGSWHRNSREDDWVVVER